MRSSSSTTLSRFAVQSPIGDLIEPLTRLAVHVVEVKEIAQRPEVLPDVTDAAAFHFSLFPSTRLIAGAWVKVELTGKGQETRIEGCYTRSPGRCRSASEMRERDNEQRSRNSGCA